MSLFVFILKSDGKCKQELMEIGTWNADVLEMVCRYLDVGSIVALAGTNKTLRLQCTNLRLRIDHPTPFWLVSALVPTIVHGMNCRQLVWRTHSDVLCVAWSMCSTRVLCSLANGRACIFHVHMGRLELHKVLMTCGLVVSFKWSPDGTKLVSGSVDCSVRIWDAATIEELHKLQGHSNAVLSVGWSPDSTRVVSGSLDMTVQIWDVITGQLLHTLQGHTHWVCAVSWNPDNNTIVSGSYDNTVWIWDVVTGQKLHKLQGHSDHVFCVGWSPDGTKVVSGSGIWKNEPRPNQAPDYSVRIWNATSGQELHKLQGHVHSVRSVHWSCNGDKVVSVSNDKTVRIWNASTGQELSVLSGHLDEVCSVEWSPDGTKIVSGSQDKTMRVWNPTL